MKRQACAIVVRPFEAADAEAVAEMMQELAVFHDDKSSTTASHVLGYASGDHPMSTILIASLDRIPCGFSATYDWMNFIHGFPVRHIDLFFVREAARKRGVGRMLLRAVAHDAKQSRCRRLTVGAESNNEGADKFYRRMGFDQRRPATNRYATSENSFDQLADE